MPDSGGEVHDFNPTTQETERWNSKFKASLVYRERVPGFIKQNPVLKNQNQKLPIRNSFPIHSYI